MPVSDSQTQGSNGDARAGSRFLAVLAAPVNVSVLQALEEGSMASLSDLSRVAGSPAQTTLRAHLRDLAELGLLERRLQSSGSTDLELTTVGFEFLEDAQVVAAWLAEGSDRPIDLGTPVAKNSLKILVEGWSATLVHAFAAKPLSMIELAEVIDLNYPAIERRMRGMRSIGLLEAAPSDGRVRPYEPSEWLRRAVGPLAVAARWEQVNSIPNTEPFSQLDMEAALSLAAPLMRLPRAMTGSCRLEVEAPSGGRRSSTVGITVDANRGQIVYSVPQLEEGADAWASGPATDWFWALTEDDPDQLRMGGDKSLARATVAGMHQLLFG
jgi:predicted transcriptional regulator